MSDAPASDSAPVAQEKIGGADVQSALRAAAQHAREAVQWAKAAEGQVAVERQATVEATAKLSEAEEKFKIEMAKVEVTKIEANAKMRSADAEVISSWAKVKEVEAKSTITILKFVAWLIAIISPTGTVAYVGSDIKEQMRQNVLNLAKNVQEQKEKAVAQTSAITSLTSVLAKERDSRAKMEQEWLAKLRDQDEQRKKDAVEFASLVKNVDSSLQDALAGMARREMRRGAEELVGGPMGVVTGGPVDREKIDMLRKNKERYIDMMVERQRGTKASQKDPAELRAMAAEELERYIRALEGDDVARQKPR